jgi:hypothetical protein
VEAIRQLSMTGAMTRQASAIEAFLTAKRLDRLGLDRTINHVNDVVREIFVVLPNHPRGRIAPFGSEGGTPRWAVAEDSGRKTVWNTTTRNPAVTAATLFNDGNFRNGLRPDAAARLSEILTNSGQTAKPPREALTVFLLRDEEFNEDPTEEAVRDRFQDRFGISSGEAATICLDRALGVSHFGLPPWSPAALPDDLLPPAEQVAATRGHAVATIPAPLVVDERVRRMVRLSILSTAAVILVGPPGTGKTTLLVETVDEVFDDPEAFGFTAEKRPAFLVTPEEGWTTRELVGGETVDEKNRLRFRPGWVLNAIAADRWLVLDEMNRADMDKIFGGLLTWLSDQPVALGRVSTHLNAPLVELGWADTPQSQTERVEALEADSPEEKPVRYLAGTEWRLLGTYNALDAQRVFRFGQALGRRFVRVPIPAPPPEDFAEALQGPGETLPEDIRARIVGLYAAHFENERTVLGPALFLRIPAYVNAGLELPDAAEVGDEATEPLKPETPLAEELPAQPAGSAAAANGTGIVEEPAQAEPADRTVRLVTEAYLVNVGTWLALIDETDVDGLGERIATHNALPKEEWKWLRALLSALG